MTVKKTKTLGIEDFDEISIKMPDGIILESNITERLMVNKDLPSDIMSKMANCAAEYARWAIVRSDLFSYKELLENKKEVFEMQIMAKERKSLGEKAAQTLVREKAVLNNLEEYHLIKAKVLEAAAALEKVKLLMKAIEIQSETTRSVASSLRKEQELFEVGQGTLKKAKTGGKQDGKSK